MRLDDLLRRLAMKTTGDGHYLVLLAYHSGLKHYHWMQGDLPRLLQPRMHGTTFHTAEFVKTQERDDMNTPIYREVP